VPIHPVIRIKALQVLCFNGRHLAYSRPASLMSVPKILAPPFPEILIPRAT
jgi:hypothetical protein